MRSTLLTTSVLLFGAAQAARPWLNEPDTGIEDIHGDVGEGELIPLDGIVGLPDFDYAARKYMPLVNYTYYRNGAAGEWSYRNNLESYQRYRFRPRVMVDVTEIESTMKCVSLLSNIATC